MNPVARVKQPRKPLPISEPSDADLSANSVLGNTIPSKGFSFFRNKKSNVTNFNYKSDGSWRVAFRGSELLSWREKHEKKAVNLFIVGKMGRGNLASPNSEYGDPVYRLELTIDKETAMAVQNILKDGPLKGFDDVRYPVLGNSAIFSAKLKNLQKTDAPKLGVDDPFPFLFDGRDIEEGRENVLEDYPVEMLSDNSMLAVETNVSSYTFPARGGSPERTGYTMSLRSVYVLAEADVFSFHESANSSTGSTGTKRQGDVLISPRKNKRAGQVVDFSDSEQN
jgi:hypothetical protein